MLVIANGAFRSGSTWLAHILRSIVDHAEIPEEYHNIPPWKKGSSIHPKKLGDFLGNVDYRHTSFVSKNHLGKAFFRDMILSHEDIFVVGMDRDIRDVLTSAYYYYRRRGEFEGSFEDFYWRRGRYIVDSIRRYHSIWQSESSRIFLSSYEKLKTDFVLEVRRIGTFLGFELSDTDIARIREETSIDRLRTDWHEENRAEDERFFRKGIVGDWKGRLNRKMLMDLEKIQERGLGNIERFILRLSSLSAREIRDRIKSCLFSR